MPSKAYSTVIPFKVVQAVQQGTLFPIQEFIDHLRHRLRAVWGDVEGVHPRETYSNLAIYQSLFAVPFDHNVRAPDRLPRHMHLNLSQRKEKKRKKRKVYADHRPCAIRKGLLISKLARASPEVPQNNTS
eukprot:255501-Pelagomonas_calceolata.AAC.1